MTKWFKENGYLSDQGKEALADFKNSVDKLLTSSEVDEMNEAELLTLQANMLNLVSKEVSAEILRRKEEVARLRAMTDENVESFLAEKYGPDYMLKAHLTKAESDRSLEIFRKRIEKAVKEAFEIRDAVISQTVLPSFDPGLPFK